MPLFGKHKKTDTTTHHGDHSNKLTRNDPNMTAGAQDPCANQGVNQGPNYGAQQGAMGSDPYAHQHTAGAPGTGAGAGMNEPPVPPATHINSDNRSGSGAGRLAGKAERGLGTLVGSQALKEKGMQKEQEAGAFKQQSAEIAEAERLEKEALLRRERAVAHGAHPDNRQLGGLQNANTLSDVHGAGNVGGAGGGYGAGSGTY